MSSGTASRSLVQRSYDAAASAAVAFVPAGALVVLILTVGACRPLATPTTHSAAISASASASTGSIDTLRSGQSPFVVVLGVAQDGGAPQTGRRDDPRWEASNVRTLVSSIGLVDADGRSWMFDATPDFPIQSRDLDVASKARGSSLPDGIFVTHAHIGHYTGLMFVGHESAGASEIPVFAMPRLSSFLKSNGPWSQLVAYQNIVLRQLEAGVDVELSQNLTVTPLLVPHRQEFSEVVAFRIDGPSRSLLYMPDIDGWEELDSTGVSIEELIGTVDVALVDGTFFANGEIPGRDMSTFPHPFIRTTITRFANLPPSERGKIYFIHMNHTNPALDPNSAAAKEIRAAGMGIAYRDLTFEL